MNLRRMRWVLGAGLLIAALGCATPAEQHQWHASFSEAETAYYHGELDAARTALEVLIPNAPDLVLQREARFRLAMVLVEQREIVAALNALAVIESEGRDHLDEWSSQAQLATAMVLESEGQPRDAMLAYIRTIERYPESAAALRAYRRILEHYGDDHPAAIQWLLASYPALEHTDLGDRTLREVAGRFQTMEDYEMAWFVWRELMVRYRYSPFRDDALLHLGKISVAIGRPEDALEFWDRIAEVHDVSWRIGDYNSKLRDNAMLERVALFVALDRHAEAADEYQRLLDAYPKYSDGARVGWERAQLLADPLQDWPAYIDTLEAIVDRYPDSVRAEWAVFQLKLIEEGASPEDVWARKPERARPWLEDRP